MRKQTRRSISISGPLYDRVRAYCEAQKISLSSLVEEVVALHLGAAPEEEGQEIDLVEDTRQDDGHAQDDEPVQDVEPARLDHATIEVIAERESERRPPPRRPAADPSLRPHQDLTNPELGVYIPPHLLF
jgi:hypothetical protein